ERSEAGCLDRGEMHEHVLAALLGDEAEPLRIIEPLHGTLWHCWPSWNDGGATPSRSRGRTARHRSIVVAARCRKDAGRSRFGQAEPLALPGHRAYHPPVSRPAALATRSFADRAAALAHCILRAGEAPRMVAFDDTL